jgi:hypothetical protein
MGLAANDGRASDKGVQLSYFMRELDAFFIGFWWGTT